MDIDIINCLPSLLYYSFETNDIFSPKLKEYINDREKVLKDNNITKQQVIICINRDRNYNKNNWLKELSKELLVNKETLYNIIISSPMLTISTDNIDNKMSSIITQYLNIIEEDLVQQAIQHFLDIDNELCIINMYDGANIEIKEGIDYDFELARINSKISYMKYIKFKYKSTDCSIEIPIRESEFLDYDTIKIDFEKTHFLVKQPYTFWKEGIDSDQQKQFYQISSTDFKLECEEYQHEYINDKGIVKQDSIFKFWIKDKNKRYYESII